MSASHSTLTGRQKRTYQYTVTTALLVHYNQTTGLFAGCSDVHYGRHVIYWRMTQSVEHSTNWQIYRYHCTEKQSVMVRPLQIYTLKGIRKDGIQITGHSFLWYVVCKKPVACSTILHAGRPWSHRSADMVDVIHAMERSPGIITRQFSHCHISQQMVVRVLHGQ
jgi:hypothetical protein